MCFVWIWEQTAIISLYSINWLVFITETECVYCAVRTGSLYRIRVTFVYTQLIKLQYKALRATSWQTWQDTSERPYRFSVEMKLHLRDSCRNPPPPLSLPQLPPSLVMTFRFLTIYLLLCLSDTASSLGSSLHSVGNAQGSEGSQFFLNFKLALLAHTSHNVSELQTGSQVLVIASLLSYPPRKNSLQNIFKLERCT